MKSRLFALVAGIAIALSSGVIAQISGGGPEGGGTRPGGTNFSTQYKSGNALGGTGPGTSGQVLTSRGAGLSPTYQTITSGSTFGADAKSVWSVTTADLSIGTLAVPALIHGPDGSGTAGANLTIRAGLGSSAAGGDLALRSGDGGGGGGAAGTLSILAGAGTVNGNGGNINITGGAPQNNGGVGPALGGSVTVTGSNSDAGTPGGVTLNTGTSTAGTGGTILLKTKNVTRVTISGTGATTFDGSVLYTSDVTTSDSFSIASTYFRVSPSSPTTLSSGNTDDYSPSGLGSRSIFRITPDAAAGSTLTGIASQPAGMEITLFNIQTGVTGSLTIAHESASSSALNRIICPGETNLIVLAGGSVSFWRDSTTGRWRVKH